MTSINPRKRGGKRKIPILAQDAMPIYETSRSDDLSELDASISGEFDENIAIPASNTILSSEGVLLPILKKRTTIPMYSNEEVIIPSNSFNVNNSSICTPLDQDDEDDGFFNEDVSVLLGNVYSGGGDSQERIRSRIEAAKERLRIAFPLLTSQQRERYDKFKQSAIPRPVMKRVTNIIFNCDASGCRLFWVLQLTQIWLLLLLECQKCL